MTPRLARIAFAGFAALAGAVTYNALYRQTPASAKPVADEQSAKAPAARKERVEKAPAAKTKPQPDPAKRSAAPTAKGDDLAAIPLEKTSPETVKAIQRELKQRGFGALEADGAIKPVTRAAIIAFEDANRLPLKGEASEELLKYLLFGVPPAAQAEASEVRSPHAEALIKQVQRQLADRGYRVGTADGRLTPATASAIRQFEADEGLHPKGRISADVVLRLQARAPGPLANAGR